MFSLYQHPVFISLSSSSVSLSCLVSYFFITCVMLVNENIFLALILVSFVCRHNPLNLKHPLCCPFLISKKTGPSLPDCLWYPVYAKCSCVVFIFFSCWSRLFLDSGFFCPLLACFFCLILSDFCVWPTASIQNKVLALPGYLCLASFFAPVHFCQSGQKQFNLQKNGFSNKHD